MSDERESTAGDAAAGGRDDRLVRGLLGDDVRVIVLDASDTVTEGIRRHGLDGAAAVVLGRTLVAGLALATLTKNGERVTLQLLGDGPLGGVTVDANHAGEVRGYLTRGSPPAEIGPARGPVGGALGRGIVNVIRELGLKERYGGQTEIVSGEVDEDVESYLVRSEQIESGLRCEAVPAADGTWRAVGLLLQALPGGPGARRVRELRERLRAAELAPRIGAGVPVEDLASEVVPGWSALEVRPVRFRCQCSRARVVAALALLPEQDLVELAVEGRAEVTCNFCRERYLVPGDELEELRRERGPRGQA